jgi:hypothetical protein
MSREDVDVKNLKVGDLLEWHAPKSKVRAAKAAGDSRWYALVVKLEQPHIWIKWLANGEVEDAMRSSANIRVVSRK